MDLKHYASVRDRIRAVVLALEGRTALQIGQVLGRHFRWVQRWVYRYREEGLAGLKDRPWLGQPTKLAKDQVAAFEARITAGSGSGIFSGFWPRSLRLFIVNPGSAGSCTD